MADIQQGMVVELISQPGKKLTVESLTPNGDRAVCVWFAQPGESYEDEEGKPRVAEGDAELVRKAFLLNDLRAG